MASHPYEPWMLNTSKRAALFTVPKRPFPAAPFKHRPIAQPVTLEPTAPVAHVPPAFPGFWMWIGNSRVVWFVCDLLPAIADAWKQAGRHSKALFSLDDSWLQ